MDGTLLMGLHSEEDARVIISAPGAGLAVDWETPRQSGWRTSQPCSVPRGLSSLHDPDLVIGWNVVNFDFRLLQAAPNSPKRRAASRAGALLLALVRNDQSGNVIIRGAWCWIPPIPSRAPPGSPAPAAWMRGRASVLGRGKDIEDVANRGEITELVPPDKQRRCPPATWKT